MAWAPAPPIGVDIKADLSPDTTVSWQAAAGAAGYRVYWRRTAAPTWSADQSMYVGDTNQHTLADLVIDNWYFGVASVSQDGFESPVVFPGAGGAF
jgi:hypothetical protein